MHRKDKSRQRSVAIQSTDLSDAEIEVGFLTNRLCKKAGFRNLLRKSVIIVSQENEKEKENVCLTEGKTSRSVQASLDRCGPVQKLPFTGNRSLEFTGSKGAVSEMLKVFDRGTGSANPGTSRMTSAIFSSYSMISQTNEMEKRPEEGSLAVVYNCGDKALANSRSSNLFYYEPQGARRFSDETVILIEDYQSYDYTNAAGRQETDPRQGGGILNCCSKRKRFPAAVLTKPVPISPDHWEEEDESIVCRICHEGENIEPLLQPCLCKGSVGYVHANCLKVWLEQSNTSRCELCNYPYAIKQNKKYSRLVSVKVFFRTVTDRRTLIYDAISFVVITPLTFVGVAMCIQASTLTPGSEDSSNFQMGSITRAGMLMLSGTIVVAYGVWLYTLISYYFKGWKKWYSNCYDVEILPVRMTSEERLEAAEKLNQELSRRQLSRENGSALVAVLHLPHSTSYSFYQRRLTVNDSTR